MIVGQVIEAYISRGNAYVLWPSFGGGASALALKEVEQERLTGV
jgi:hypothetical protein